MRTSNNLVTKQAPEDEFTHFEMQFHELREKPMLIEDTWSSLCAPASDPHF